LGNKRSEKGFVIEGVVVKDSQGSYTIHVTNAWHESVSAWLAERVNQRVKLGREEVRHPDLKGV
jgi:hypothetical protein